jgi:hypothetical protein
LKMQFAQIIFLFEIHIGSIFRIYFLLISCGNDLN